MEGFSQAADNNKTPILEVLTSWLSDDQLVLEVGSGTGQHAIHMAAALKGIRWQPTDCFEVLPNLIKNISTYGTSNVLTPTNLDLSLNQWPAEKVDCVYSANVIHIVSEALVEKLIRGAARTLSEEGLLALYGPFKYRGTFTTPSNADFDSWLKARNPESGVRDFEWILELAKNSGLSFSEDRSMPANNQFLAFRRQKES